jgi:hypothetical protein
MRGEEKMNYEYPRREGKTFLDETFFCICEKKD